jgi:AcrR family transcriptional regulator
VTSALVTQRLGLSPSAFYRYFGDINDAILELTAGMRVTADGIAALVDEGDWAGDGAEATALAVVDAMAGFWTEHRALYRVTELCAGEGDQRFAHVKTVTFAGLTRAFERVIASCKRAGGHGRGVDPYASACVAVTMLIHTVAREPAFDVAGVAPDALRTHLARLVRAGVTGTMPPLR